MEYRRPHGKKPLTVPSLFSIREVRRRLGDVPVAAGHGTGWLSAFVPSNGNGRGRFPPSLSDVPLAIRAIS